MGGIWFAFLGWFLLQAAQAEVAMAKVRRALAGTKVRDVMSPDPVVVPADMTVAGLLDRAPMQRRFSSYPVVEGGRPIGLVSLRMAAAVPGPEREVRRVAEVMKPITDLPVVTADQDVIEVLPRLDGEVSRALVTDEHRLLGVLSGADVLRAIDVGEATAPAEEARRAGVLVWLVVGLVILIAGAALYHPPYVVIAPGAATDASADLRIEGIPVTPVNGKYLLTSVRVSQPSALRVLVAALRPDREVLPVSALIPRGVDPDEFAERQLAVFEESQMLAAVAAARSQGLPVSVSGTGVRVLEVVRGSPGAQVLEQGDVMLAVDGQPVTEARGLAQIVSSRPVGAEFRLTIERGGQRIEREVTTRRLSALAGGIGLGITIETRGFHVDLPFEISFARRDIGGPSAGLAYALAIADMLAAEDYAQGEVIAATGTIDADGDVGPVGGVEQKAVAAEEAGAQRFLVPAGEVDEASDAEVPVQGVEDLREALSVLVAT